MPAMRSAAGERAGLEHGLRLRLERALAAAVFALLTSGAAQVAIPLPPDGVPMTLQTLAVLCAALCIGPRLGTASMLIYLLVGVVGGAVFAQGTKGAAVIAGQTGGYLVGSSCASRWWAR